MERFAKQIVAKRKIILAVGIIFSLVCAGLTLKVGINLDMTKYLPPSSSMKQGIDILAQEFPDLPNPSTIRVMVKDLPSSEVEMVKNALAEIENVDSVTWDETQAHHREADGSTYDLFTLSTSCEYQSREELAIEAAAKKLISANPEALEGKTYEVEVKNDDATSMQVPVFIFIVAIIILLAVLFAMCGSWVEPFLFLAAIGMAILMNMGTNIVLGEISSITWSIAAVLQLVLSMDYSIILMNRYRQEKAKISSEMTTRQGGTGENTPGQERSRQSDNERAMVHAWMNAFSSITSSGFTTFVGLIMLVFMRFRMGRDLGIVLAKGVFFSMVCVLTLLPALILLFDRQVEATKKGVLYIPVNRLAAFSYRCRRVMVPVFIILFVAAWIGQRMCGFSYMLKQDDPIAEIFPSDNPVVMLYANEREDAAAALALDLEENNEHVTAVQCYATTLGRQMTAQEMADAIPQMAGSYASMLPAAADSGDQEAGLPEVNAETLQALYGLYGASHQKQADTLSMEELFTYVAEELANQPLISVMLGSQLSGQLSDMKELLAQGKSMLVGPKYSLMMISTSYPLESEETTAFIDSLQAYADEKMSGEVYLIGNSPMNVEMARSFDSELLLITLLTASSIFLVVAVTFRRLTIPLMLVMLVQCGVYLTVITTGLLGYKMYYLALVIVQCVLMGATVDYGILFTNYYLEKRRDFDIREALERAYGGSVHTILTSGLFMIVVTGAIGFSPADPTIAQICKTISLGAASATILVLFILPGMLAGIDRLIVRQKDHGGH